MAVTIRAVADGDFFSWLGLYEQYAAFYDVALTDEKALVVWSWLTDPAHEEAGLVAVDDDGALVGLAHLREYARPLQSNRGLFVDDIFVSEQARGHGAGKALIDAARALAAERKLGVVQMASPQDNESARRLYDEVATPTQLVTYEIAV